jgi:hypothetical protein
MRQNLKVEIGGFRVLYPKSGKFFGIPTLVFNVYTQAEFLNDDYSFLKAGVRLVEGVLKPPVVSYGFGNYYETAWFSRQIAVAIYDELVKAFKEKKITDPKVKPPVEDLETAINYLLPRRVRIMELMGEYRSKKKVED